MAQLIASNHLQYTTKKLLWEEERNRHFQISVLNGLYRKFIFKWQAGLSDIIPDNQQAMLSDIMFDNRQAMSRWPIIAIGRLLGCTPSPQDRMVNHAAARFFKTLLHPAGAGDEQREKYTIMGLVPFLILFCIHNSYFALRVPIFRIHGISNRTMKKLLINQDTGEMKRCEEKLLRTACLRTPSQFNRQETFTVSSSSTRNP